MRPKIAGAWNLHVATRELPLDFFVTYSSITSVLGTPGQELRAGTRSSTRLRACGGAWRSRPQHQLGSVGRVGRPRDERGIVLKLDSPPRAYRGRGHPLAAARRGGRRGCRRAGRRSARFFQAYPLSGRSSLRRVLRTGLACGRPHLDAGKAASGRVSRRELDCSRRSSEAGSRPLRHIGTNVPLASSCRTWAPTRYGCRLHNQLERELGRTIPDASPPGDDGKAWRGNRVVVDSRPARPEGG